MGSSEAAEFIHSATSKGMETEEGTEVWRSSTIARTGSLHPSTIQTDNWDAQLRPTPDLTPLLCGVGTPELNMEEQVLSTRSHLP